MNNISTWAAKSNFKYEGSVLEGTKVYFGKGSSIYVSSDMFKKLLDFFDGREVKIGTSRDNPPAGSLGEWLNENISKSAIASYVGAILVFEGYAHKVKHGYIQIDK